MGTLKNIEQAEEVSTSYLMLNGPHHSVKAHRLQLAMLPFAADELLKRQAPTVRQVVIQHPYA